MSSQQTCKVVYNNCYGGFDLSTSGLEEYNRRTTKNVTLSDYIDREDPVLIEMVETIDRKEINMKHSKLQIKEFPLKFKSFLLWHDYDGKENVSIDYHKYIVDNVKFILDTNTTDKEKIELITKLYNDLDKIKCRECNEYMCMHITPVGV